MVGRPVYVTMTRPELVGRKGADGASVPGGTTVGTMPPLDPPPMAAHWFWDGS